MRSNPSKNGSFSRLRFFSGSSNMSSSSSGQRFADYFVVSGLDLVTGLEADQLSGL